MAEVVIDSYKIGGITSGGYYPMSTIAPQEAHVAVFRQGQSFTSARTYMVTSSAFWMARNTSDSDDKWRFVSRICTHSGTYGSSSISGDVLGTSDEISSDIIIGSTYPAPAFPLRNLVTFTFSTPVLIGVGNYTVELLCTKGSATVYYGCGPCVSGDTPLHGGNNFQCYRHDSNNTWVAPISVNYPDMPFAVYGYPVSQVTASAIVGLRSSITSTSYVYWDYPSPSTFGRGGVSVPQGNVEYQKISGASSAPTVSGSLTNPRPGGSIEE